jgi:hypothetical protein
MISPHRTLDLAALRVDALKVVDQVPDEPEFRLRDGGIGLDAVDDRDRVTGPQLLAYPPGTRPASRLCSRRIAWVRSRPRSW